MAAAHGGAAWRRSNAAESAVAGRCTDEVVVRPEVEHPVAGGAHRETRAVRDPRRGALGAQGAEMLDRRAIGDGAVCGAHLHCMKPEHLMRQKLERR